VLVDERGIVSDYAICGPHWSPALTVWHVLLTIRQNLTDPDLEMAERDTGLHGAAGRAKLFRTDRAAFNKTAREWAVRYAGAK
jgi:ubiquitin-protein ligase